VATEATLKYPVVRLKIQLMVR